MCTTQPQTERAFHPVNMEMQKYRLEKPLTKMGDEILPHLKNTSKSHALLGEVNSKRVSQSGKHGKA